MQEKREVLSKEIVLVKKKMSVYKIKHCWKFDKVPNFSIIIFLYGGIQGTYCLLEKLVLQLLLLHYQEKFPMKMCGHAVVKENLW